MTELVTADEMLEGNTQGDVDIKFGQKKESKVWQIVIEGHNAEQMQDFFEEIQNKYSLYDNSIIQEANPEDTIIDSDRYEETGKIIIDRELVKKHGE
jgi:hypothetical protein